MLLTKARGASQIYGVMLNLGFVVVVVFSLQVYFVALAVTSRFSFEVMWDTVNSA